MSINVCEVQSGQNASSNQSGKTSGLGVFEALFENLLANSEMNQEGMTDESSLLNLEGELKLSLDKLFELANKIEDEASRADYLEKLQNLAANSEYNQEIAIQNAEALSQLVSMLEKMDLKLEAIEQKRSLLDYLLKLDAASVQKEIKLDGISSKEVVQKHTSTMELMGVEMVEEKNPFDELKKHRLELEGVSEGTVETRWQVVGVQKTNLNIEDLSDVIKEQIEKLSEFRIENRQKVSMVIKEQGEELRITLEKQGDVIKIGASVSESMKDRVDDVLMEIKNEMREKGIEIEIDLKDSEEREQEDTDQEQSQDKHSQNHENEGDNDAGKFSNKYND